MAKKEAEAISIKPIEIEKVKIRIVGDSPLIVHAWSEKAKKMMLDTQMKVTKTKGLRHERASFPISMGTFSL